MKIVQVTPRYPPHTGGVETHVKEIGEQLIERGHEVIVLTADASADVVNEEERNGVVVKRHRSFAPGGAFHIAPQIALAVRSENADVVHAHNYHSLPAFFAALGLTKERFVVTSHYHGASASDRRDQLLLLYRPLGGWALHRADVVIAVTEWEREQLCSDFDVDATVIPNGLNVARFANADPEDRKRPYLLCVGRLVEYKGVQYVVRALPELPEYDLVVAGSGPYREELERIVDEVGVTDRVDFLGYVDDEHLPSLYAGAAVYVTLSEFEAYGMTVAEALSAGTPRVVLKAQALSSWTQCEGCIGVSTTEPRTVADALREAVSKSFSDLSFPTWTEVVDELESCYRIC